ncbi:unnamed protein product [Medioppia subpectinata]|uniref:Nuclear pore complex protein Nup153 n=1 Tax=Medioppia subpectinata TaxID=1979941 RepID=A0A7R9PXN2_9ACAR|nr:unnamed protein product [Medioppia subpectinata]CAG2104991.1 unnamed protein product [Medioppia subpectinata]
MSRPSYFYEGRTRFGGTNNARAARLTAGTTPYSVSARLAPMVTLRPQQRPVAVSASAASVSAPEAGLSASSRRILELLERASTPVQDARRQPYSSATASARQHYFTSASDYSLRASKRPRMGGPPTGATPLASQAVIDRRFAPQKWELKLVPDADGAAKLSVAPKTTDELIASAAREDNTRLADRFDPKMLGRVQRREERRGAKIHVNDNQEDDDQCLQRLAAVQPLAIPSGALLPTFTFSKSSTAVTDRKPASDAVRKPITTTTVTKIFATEEDDECPVFAFTEPVLKRKARKLSIRGIDESPPPVDGKKGSFVFSSPAASLPVTNNKSNGINDLIKASTAPPVTPIPPLGAKTRDSTPAVSAATFNGLDAISTTPSFTTITTSTTTTAKTTTTAPKPQLDSPAVDSPKRVDPKLFSFGVPFSASNTTSGSSSSPTVPTQQQLITKSSPKASTPTKTLPSFGAFGTIDKFKRKARKLSIRGIDESPPPVDGKKGSFVFSSPAASLPVTNNKSNGINDLIKASTAPPVTPIPPLGAKTRDSTPAVSAATFNGLDAISTTPSFTTITTSTTTTAKTTTTAPKPQLDSPAVDSPKRVDPKLFSFGVPFSAISCLSATVAAAAPAPVGAVFDGWGDKFKQASGTWSCPVCCISNKDSDSRCLACEEPKPGGGGGTTTSKDTFSDIKTANKSGFGGNTSAFSSLPALQDNNQPLFVFGTPSEVKVSTTTSASFGGFGIASPAPAVTQPTSTPLSSTFGGFGSTPLAPVMTQSSSQSATSASTTTASFGNFGGNALTASATGLSQFKASTTTSPLAANPTFGGFGLTTLAPVVTQQSASSAATKTGITFGGFGQSATPAVTTQSQPTSSAAPFVFGGFSTNQASAPTASKSSPPTSSAAPFVFGGFSTNQASAPTASKSSPVTSTTTASSFISFGANNSTATTASVPAVKPPPAYTFGGFGGASGGQSTTPSITQFQSPSQSTPTFGGFGATPAMPSVPKSTTSATDSSAATQQSKPESKLFQFGTQSATAGQQSSKEQIKSSPFGFGGFGGNQSTATTAATAAAPVSQTPANPTPFTFGSTFGSGNQSVPTAVPQSQSAPQQQPKVPSFSFNGFGNNSAPSTGAQPSLPSFTSQSQSSATGTPFTFGGFGSAQSASAPTSQTGPKPPSFAFNGFGNNSNTPTAPAPVNQFSSSQSQAVTTAGAAAPFAFGGFGTTQSAPTPVVPTVPQFQSQPAAQPLLPTAPQFNFTQQPSFDFASMASTGAAAAQPLFQFSAEPTAQTTATNRFIKKAKRRLNPS